jgi:hypothetical protein
MFILLGSVSCHPNSDGFKAVFTDTELLPFRTESEGYAHRTTYILPSFLLMQTLGLFLCRLC